MSTGWGSGIMASIRRPPELKCDHQELDMGGEGEGEIVANCSVHEREFIRSQEARGRGVHSEWQMANGEWQKQQIASGRAANGK